MQTERQLELTDLEQVNGGMKWTPGTRNDDVIDARGGSFSFFGLTFTFDRGGGLSSIYYAR
jgi:hypothetical protein